MSHNAIPKYRRQKSQTSDRAFVDLNGVRHYLGAYDSAESREKYHRLLAEWSANGQQTRVEKIQLTVIELDERFWEHVKTYYVRADGTQTSEVSNFKQVLNVLNTLYARTPVNKFGPLALKAIRQKMIEMKWVRTSINKQIGRLKMIFRWGVAEELVEATVNQALCAVPGLKLGRSVAVESERVVPVSDAHIEAVTTRVSEQVWAIIQLQLLTAARSGELVMMKPSNLDRTGTAWIYKPASHKTIVPVTPSFFAKAMYVSGMMRR